MLFVLGGRRRASLLRRGGCADSDPISGFARLCDENVAVALVKYACYARKFVVIRGVWGIGPRRFVICEDGTKAGTNHD